jgi:hypothetical protein
VSARTADCVHTDARREEGGEGKEGEEGGQEKEGEEGGEGPTASADT